jgi:hypothetical protein
LFSLLQIEDALTGADLAIYLVHSMLPTAKLTQGSFADSDLLLADNFARAAKKCNVKRVLYLGGLIPEHENLSRHLQSRLEVEQALASQGVPVTTLRSGLILGARGSSFQILYLLVRRLPIMLCPKWVWTLTQAIAVDDVVNLISFCISENKTIGNSYDIGGPDVVTYRDLMQKVSEKLALHRYFFRVPLFTPGLSRLWVQLITGASSNLISPLIQSLRHTMLVRNPELIHLYGKPLTDLDTAITKCLNETPPSLRLTTRQRRKSQNKSQDVRSIQRLILPKGKNAEWIAQEYFRWLPKFLSPLIRVLEVQPEVWDFQFRGVNLSLLTLRFSKERSTPDRQIFYIQGGKLAQLHPTFRGRLEFRQVLGDRFVLAAIHEFVPRLPWFIYKYTQALLHIWVMKNFGAHLLKEDR